MFCKELIAIKTDLFKEEKPNTIFGIQFAPLNISIERRLQTFAAAFVLCSLISGFFCSLFVWILILFTPYWLLGVLYYIWIYYDKETAHSGGRKIQWIRNLKFWEYASDYFPAKLIKTADLPPDKNYLFCVYPHGILSISSFVHFCTEANDFSKLYPGIDPYRMTLDLNFNSPFTREFYLATGNCSSSERSLVNLLERPNSTACILVVGGAAESSMAFPGTYRILLNRRSGFIRVALQTGASVVPVVSFGENDLYDQYTGKWIKTFQEFARNLTTISPIIMLGRGLFQYTFGILPHRAPVNTVVGAPIDLPKIKNPSKELVNEYKEKYTTELQKLFETYKEKYSREGKNSELVIE